MAEQPQTRAQGPGKGVLDIAQRIVTIMVGMVETRVRLAVVELEEEKANLIQLLMMAGLTLLFTAFGLMSLLILIFWAIDPAYRLMALGTTTAVLLFLAVVGIVWTLSKARRSTLLGATRQQLELDRAELEEKHESPPVP
ncbi:phage holin family protein [Serratia sp. (in: enterobacteria)]|uniref:phage holin family protein n=1 Tax=Serratia sp. (in: enterobacteria) TaxID=616 RepID=UPI0039895F65